MNFRIFCGAGLCAPLLATAPALAAPKLLAPSMTTMNQFVLAPQSRGVRPHRLPLQADLDAPAAPRPDLPAPAPLAESLPLDELLTIRDDLRFLVNAAIKDVRKERIALGLHFARVF